MENQSIDAWMRRGLIGACALFLVASSYLLWRIAVMTYRIEESIVAVGADVRRISSTAAGLAEKVDQLGGKIDSLQNRAKETLHIDEMKHIVDELAELKESRKQGDKKLDEKTEAEIVYLLSYVRDSELKFLNEGKEHSSDWFFAKLYVKYKLYKSTLGSAEDFIQSAAVESMKNGKPYQVILKSGEKKELRAWLTEALAAYRESTAKRR